MESRKNKGKNHETKTRSVTGKENKAKAKGPWTEALVRRWEQRKGPAMQSKRGAKDQGVPRLAHFRNNRQLEASLLLLVS